jgi:hypothetical protein
VTRDDSRFKSRWVSKLCCCCFGGEKRRREARQGGHGRPNKTLASVTARRAGVHLACCQGMCDAAMDRPWPPPCYVPVCPAGLSAHCQLDKGRRASPELALQPPLPKACVRGQRGVCAPPAPSYSFIGSGVDAGKGGALCFVVFSTLIDDDA